ncbi:MAG: hypothetical protein QM754_02000 [Tepidisphaeraceae bacterium]
MEESAPRPTPAAADPLAAPAFDRRRIRRWSFVVAGVLMILYLALQNPYWVPGGDSDFYVAIARSMARGQGFLYNGFPVAISPPGWPWAMAQVLKISPTFLALKLTAMLSMYGSLVIGYFIALRFLKPRIACWATILAGLLMPVYSLTYFLHSEGLYCLLSATALLLALRLREGRGGKLHIFGLIALSVAIPLVRFAGVFQLLPIVAVLMSGRRGLPLVQRHWKTALVCALMIVGVWVGTREALKVSKEDQKKWALEGGIGTGETDVEEQPSSNEMNGPTIDQGMKDAKHGPVREYLDRTWRAGKWFSWTLWQPSRFVSVIKAADVFVILLGWGVILMLGYLAVVEAKRGEWLWVSLALYTGGLCLNWDNPNSRYFVPVAPLIIVGLILATRRLSARIPLATFDLWKWLRRGLVYSILLCNLAMYGVDVIVMRNPKFYETFEAGQHKDLIAISHYLMSLPPQPAEPATGPTTRRTPTTAEAIEASYAQIRPEDGDIMINERYENLGRVRFSKAGSRSMVLLTDRFLKPLDYGKLSRAIEPPFPVSLGTAMRRRNTEWLLVQEKSVPWRVWHFHLPMDWYQRLSKNAESTPSGGWKLYHFSRYDRTFTEQPVPPIENWPTRVPGM